MFENINIEVLKRYSWKKVKLKMGMKEADWLLMYSEWKYYFVHNSKTTFRWWSPIGMPTRYSYSWCFWCVWDGYYNWELSLLNDFRFIT